MEVFSIFASENIFIHFKTVFFFLQGDLWALNGFLTGKQSQTHFFVIAIGELCRNTAGVCGIPLHAFLSCSLHTNTTYHETTSEPRTFPREFVPGFASGTSPVV